MERKAMGVFAAIAQKQPEPMHCPYISRGSLQMVGALNTPPYNLARNSLAEAQGWAR